MYLPRRFEDSTHDALDTLFERDGFITLVTLDAEGLPFASHLPVLYRREGERVLLEGHWARANPQSRHAGAALAIVLGAHAYISPSWYPDPSQHVPTWNYTVAHLHGRLEIFDTADALQALVAELSEKYESAVGSDWRFPEAAPGSVDELRGIVGFRLRVERWQIKAKLNQNHPEENVRGAAAALAAQGGQAAEVAAMMLARLPG
jgi:transcriptional regulator